MSKHTRRGLIAMLAAIPAAPLAKMLPEPPEPMPDILHKNITPESMCELIDWRIREDRHIINQHITTDIYSGVFND